MKSITTIPCLAVALFSLATQGQSTAEVTSGSLALAQFQATNLLAGAEGTNALTPGTIFESQADLQNQLAHEAAIEAGLSSGTPTNIPTLPNAGSLAAQAVVPTEPLIPEKIEIQAGSAFASYARHKARFPGNANSEEGIQLTIPARNGDVRFRTRLLGLCFWDRSSGESSLFAWPKDSSGEVVGGGVAYLNALEGTDADLTYEYTRTSFEQNVILRKQIPTPEELGFSGDPSNICLAVVTEFIDLPESVRVPSPIDLRTNNQVLGVQGEALLANETIYLGSMHMVDSKAFLLGASGAEVPSGKALMNIDGRWLLFEFTPWPVLEAMMEQLPAGTLHAQALRSPDLKRMLATSPKPSRHPPAAVRLAKVEPVARPGVVLDYRIVTAPLLNVNFGSNAKTGFAAIGQTSADYWNTYNFPGVTLGTLSNLRWSDSSSSSITLSVANAPGIWTWSGGDPMYDQAIYQNPGSGNITVTLTGLPANTYDLYVYGHYGIVDGNGIYQLSRAGTVIARRGTSIWGRTSLSAFWEEGQQYVVFRGVSVNNQILTIDAQPNGVGSPCINGLQIVPSAAVPPPSQAMMGLINVDFAANPGNKVGPAATGITSSDFWNTWAGGSGSATISPLRDYANAATAASLTILNAPGGWGWSVGDSMYGSYNYPQDGGNYTFTINSLPVGNYDFYLYGHSATDDDNTVFHLWTAGRDCDTKGTSIYGTGANSINWAEGQQYVVFHDVAVAANQTVTIVGGHNGYGYAYINGIQMVNKATSWDTDGDGLPDAWEQQYFGNLNQSGSGDFDGDGITNLSEYLASSNPTRSDTDSNGIGDINDPELAWVEDAVPRGSYQATSSETWNWVSFWQSADGWGGAKVNHRSGNLMHVSALVPGALHQHYFYDAPVNFMVNVGETLYAYINLDSANVPAEIMLQWYVRESNGASSWEHRAYWGANNINAGVSGTVSRYYMGGIPAAGTWIRLEVPASAVGLEGKIIQGMAFSLWGGRAAWDRAGKLVPSGISSCCTSTESFRRAQIALP